MDIATITPLDARLAQEALARVQREKVPPLAKFIRERCWGRDEQTGETFPAKEWPSQVKLREALEASRLVVGLKAAGVGWTWELAWVTLWYMAQTGRQVIFLCQRMDNAEHWMTRRLNWAREQMLERGIPYPRPAKQPTLSELRLENGSECLAFPGSPDATRMHHPALIILDEWAQLNQPVLAAFTGRTRGRGQIVGISTARGDCACRKCSESGTGPQEATNEFAHVYRDARDHGGREAGFVRVFAPWTDCPDYGAVRPSAGSRALTEQEYPQDEYEAFVRSFAGEPVYPEFLRETHVAKAPLAVLQGLPIVWGWDVGSDTRSPAVVPMQFPPGQMRVLHPSVQMNGPSITALGRHVLSVANNHFGGHEWLHYGDPSGENRSATDELSPFDLLRREFGFYIRPGPQNMSVRREAVAHFMLRSTLDGQPGFLVDPREENLVDGFMGGYQRSAQEGLRPVKNAYSHRQDCLQYAAAAYLRRAQGLRARTWQVETKHGGSAYTGY